MTLQSESAVSLTSWDTCDNMDLFYILQDYEEYHQIKFNKIPKFVKKLAEKDGIN
jgi:hypothetical protein